MKKKVLIIDDDEEFLEELKEMLSLSGYELIAVSDGYAAVNITKLTKPDIVLVDIKMKGLNGFQVVDRLNQDPDTAGIPIIAMTAYFTNDEHLRLMQVLGIKKILQKPLKPLDVISIIEESVKD